jgi:hypothetical protein
MNNRRKQSMSKKGRRCRDTRKRIWRGSQDQFAREATRRESAAVTKYGMAAYDREELRRDERGRILR